MIRMIFSTVRAPQEPALTVESLAISATGRPSMVAVPVITPSAGRPLGQHVGESAVLGEAAGVDQQLDPVPGEQLALPRRPARDSAGAPPREIRALISARSGWPPSPPWIRCCWSLLLRQCSRWRAYDSRAGAAGVEGQPPRHESRGLRSANGYAD